MEEAVSGHRVLKASILALPIFCASVACALAQQAPASEAAKNLKPVTNEMLRNPPAADWLMWRRTYDGYGFSPLDQINKDNVKNLKPAWSWSMNPGATETTPIVHDGVLFLNHNGDKIQALDGATGDLIWEYKRDLPAKLLSENSNQLTKRNMAIYGDNLYIATSDAHIVALDAKTGKVVWDHTVADWTKGWRYSGGPFIVNDTLVQGMTGCGNATPGGCFITGHDVKTGAEKWRVHTIAHAGDPNFDTWNDIPLESRYGGSAWISGSYDPEQDLVFYGTGQPYPWIAEMNGLLPKKPGAKNNALYTDSTLAIEPKTGKVRWYRQHLETDTWDLDYAYERMLIDLPVNGVTRKALVTTGKLGIIEAIDRTNGEWLWHKETIPQNVVTSIDPKTGEKTINQASVPHIGQTTVNCPADPGGRGWPATAYNPNTGTLYLPLNEYCSNTTPSPLDPGQAYRRRPRHFCADAGPQQRRQYRPRRRHQAGGSLDGLDRPNPHAADGRSASDRRRRRVRRRVGPLVPRLRRRHRQGAVGDQIEQCAQFVPGHLQRQRQAICGRGRRQRLQPRAFPRHADAGNQEPGRRFGAVGVCAAELVAHQ